MCKGRRIAHAERWPAREPECFRGHPGPLRAYPDPLRAWAHRWASETAALCGWSRSAPWVERAAGAALKVPGTRAPSLRGRREGSWGARGAGQRDSMSQQRTARRLPSLLVDPAQETVRRRCRDPINVENLLVSGDPGHGGWGVSHAVGRAPCVRPSAQCRLVPWGSPCSTGFLNHPLLFKCFYWIYFVLGWGP